MSKPHNTAEGYITAHYYEHKTVRGFNWSEGHYVKRTLSRSFDTLEAAQKFAENKDAEDIFRSKGRFVVRWVKTTHLQDETEEREG